MRRVIIESPYEAYDSQGIELNLRYLRACMADCIRRGESPFASHGLYTQPGVLRDQVAEERAAGINAGFAWRRAADATVVYTDLGTSTGMGYGIKAAEQLIAERAQNSGRGRGRCEGDVWHVIEYRTLPDFDMWCGDPAFETSRWGK